LARLVPPKLIFGESYGETLNEIRAAEYLSRQKLEALRAVRLARILIHSFRTTEYYREVFRERKIGDRDILSAPDEVLSELPTVDKSAIKGEYERFVSSSKSEVKCDKISTGGTSGEPLIFHINADRSPKEWAFMVDQWSRVGFRLGDGRATFRGSKIQGRGWEDDFITKERRFSSFEMTDSYLRKMWPRLNEYQPKFVYAYPSTALALCQFMARNSYRLPDSVIGVLLGSENIYEGQRGYIEEVTEKRAFMWYGHSEKLVLAGECEHSKNYHAHPLYGYVEFINKKGEQAKAGEFAEIVGTGFMNTVLPFIRYRTGDYCIYLGKGCSNCGRNYDLFKNVRGRWTQEVLYGIGGNSICMSAINIHSKVMENVFRFQFFQEKPGKAILKILPRDGFSESERGVIEREFNDKLGRNVDVEAVLVEDIPLTRRGKYKFIDQRIKSMDLPFDRQRRLQGL
jgi:phenylacetate-CoA ligase